MPKEADPICDGDSSSNDEGDNNKSFVKKVKSHVTGFLPTTLSKWLGAKSRQRDDLGDEDDTYELQPPQKRAKTHNLEYEMSMNSTMMATPMPSGLRNPFSQGQEFREPVPGPSITTRKLVLPVSNHYNQNPNTDQTNGIDSDSGESTSGYSSMPRIGSKEHVSELPTQPMHNNTSNIGNKSIFNTSIPFERSLFGDNFTSPKQSNTTLSSRRPSFNASAFGAPNFMDKTLSTRRIFNSPFYSGRITYGGASAYNRSILNQSPEPVPHSPTVRPKAVNENKNVALSKTAKRILDTLEQYTSPAQDVRRIPTAERRSQRPEGLISKYVGANPYMVREVQKTPSTRELQVPTMSELLKMKLKERLQDSTSTVRDIANQSFSALNSEDYSIANNDDKPSGGKSSNKIKTKVSSVRQKAMPVDEVVPEVKLPDVQLPISTLPSFNFSIPFSKPAETKKPDSIPEGNNQKPTIDNFKSSDTSKSFVGINSFKMTTKPSTTPLPVINFKNPEVASPVSKATATPPKLSNVLQDIKQLVKTTSSNDVLFKFSKPLVIAENLKSIKAINNFKFSNPLVKKTLNGLPEFKEIKTKDLNVKEVVGVTQSSLPKSGFGDMFKVGNDKWECSVCMVRNISTATSCISCTTPKSSGNKTKTVNGPTQPLTSSSWGDKFKAPSSSWSCDVCMITNDVAKDKCAACESPKPKPAGNASVAVTTNATSKVTFEGFGKKTNEWQCPSCMVNNANTKDKCVCCETAKPGDKTNVLSKPLTSGSSWGDKFKVAATTWECSMCMIRNNVDKDKCEACENPRPAGVGPAKGIEGFGKKDTEWECTSCMVRNPSNKDKCVCCEASKPGSIKPVPTAQAKEVPKFSFGIENGLINGQGFMFGIPADKNTKSAEVTKPVAAVPNKESTASSSQFLFGIKSPNGAKIVSTTSSAPTSIAGASEKPTSAVPAFSFGIPSGSKRPASSDETDVAKTPKKTENAFPASTTINGNLGLGAKTEDATKVLDVSSTFGNNNKSLFGSSTGASLEKSKEASKFTFGSTGTTTPAFSFNATPTLKNDVIAAPAVPSSDANAGTKPTAPVFKFNTTLTPAPTNTSSAVAALAPTTMFNSGNATNGSTPTPSFNFSAPASASKPEVKPSESAAFKYGATNSVKSSNSFATAAPPTFGSATGGTVFGGAALASTVAPPSNVFGSNPTNTPNATPTFGSNMSFGGGSNNSASSFGAPKQDTPAFGSTAPSTFGAASTTFGKPAAATNGVFSFGNAAQAAAPSEAKPAFNFGAAATTSTPRAFTFGPANTQNTNGAYSFGASDAAVPNFNATAKPTFNFSAGVPTTAFSAQPNETKAPPPNRVIRRAVRRTQR